MTLQSLSLIHIFVVAVGLASQGVVQNMKEYETVRLLEPVRAEDGEEITEATVPMLSLIHI